MKTFGVSTSDTLVVIAVSQAAECRALTDWCRSLELEPVILAQEHPFLAPIGRRCLGVVERVPPAAECLLPSRMVDTFILFIVEEGAPIPTAFTPETMPPRFDFLRRPFGTAELLWRAGWGLSQLSLGYAHASVPSSEAWRCGPIQYDLSQHEVKVHDVPLDLRPAERALLAYLFRNHHRCVTANEIVREVLHSSGDGAAARNQIYELRRKLRAAGVPEMISTEGRCGYRLVWSSNPAGLDDSTAAGGHADAGEDVNGR